MVNSQFTGGSIQCSYTQTCIWVFNLYIKHIWSRSSSLHLEQNGREKCVGAFAIFCVKEKGVWAHALQAGLNHKSEWEGYAFLSSERQRFCSDVYPWRTGEHSLQQVFLWHLFFSHFLILMWLCIMGVCTLNRMTSSLTYDSRQEMYMHTLQTPFFENYATSIQYQTISFHTNMDARLDKSVNIDWWPATDNNTVSRHQTMNSSWPVQTCSVQVIYCNGIEEGVRQWGVYTWDMYALDFIIEADEWRRSGQCAEDTWYKSREHLSSVLVLLSALIYGAAISVSFHCQLGDRQYSASWTQMWGPIPTGVNVEKSQMLVFTDYKGSDSELQNEMSFTVIGGHMGQLCCFKHV